jgi:hypothetical protein
MLACLLLSSPMAGCDRWLSIEYEDVMLSQREGLTKSVTSLQSVAPSEASDYAPQEFRGAAGRRRGRKRCALRRVPRPVLGSRTARPST